MSENKEYIERGAVNEKLSAMRQAMVRIYGNGIGNLSANAVDAMQTNINAIPASDVEPVVRGEWKDGIDFDEQNVYMCSVCKEPYILESGTPKENKYNFCPNCGAHMMERSGSGE